MSEPWCSAEPPARTAIGPAGWVRVLGRGAALGGVTFGGLALLLAVRLVERPLCGLRRPVTPRITQSVCRAAFALLGMEHRIEGAPIQGPGAVVANHASWLDIFALNAPMRVYFVAKAEVAGWPGIGWLARATGTLFIRRRPGEARAQTAVFAERLRAGHRLAVFPEGTSTDGRRVLAFKTTLFQSFMTPELRPGLRLQPVTIRYRAPEGADPRFYGWWGGMGFAAHLVKVLAAPRQGSVTVICHPPVAAADYPDRKALARACELRVREALPAAGAAPDDAGR